MIANVASLMYGQSSDENYSWVACTAEGIEPELWGDIVGLKETHSKAKYIKKKKKTAFD